MGSPRSGPAAASAGALSIPRVVVEGLAQGAGIVHEGRYRRGGMEADTVLLHDAMPVWRDLRYRPYEMVPTLLQARLSLLGVT